MRFEKDSMVARVDDHGSGRMALNGIEYTADLVIYESVRPKELGTLYRWLHAVQLWLGPYTLLFGLILQIILNVWVRREDIILIHLCVLDGTQTRTVRLIVRDNQE